MVSCKNKKTKKTHRAQKKQKKKKLRKFDFYVLRRSGRTGACEIYVKKK